MSFSYYKQLSINTGFSGSSHSNFPALIKLTTDSDLNAHVTNANGYDIGFFTDAGLTAQIPHELRTYSGGSLVAWFNIPAFTSSSNIYMAYGDAGIVSDQSSTDTWESAYKLVIPGRTATDKTSNAASITNNGGTTGVAGKIDQAIDFEASESDNLSISDSAALDSLTGSVSAQAWVNFESTSGGGVYFKANAQWDNYTYKTIDFGWNSGAYYFVVSKDSSTGIYSTKSTTPSIGTWYLLHGTWDGTTGTGGIKFYLNGTVSSDSSAGDNTGNQDAIKTNDLTARIGGKSNSGTNYLFDGMLEEFRLRSGSLSADWIATEYAMMNDNGAFWTVGSEQVATAGRAAAGARSASGSRTSASSRSAAGSRASV